MPITPSTAGNLGDEYAAMTFDEIAAVLGVSRQRVHQIYLEAMAKIRDNPEEVRKLAGLIEMRNSQRLSWDERWNSGEEAA